jgi:subtilisin family serine protease
MNKIVGLSFAVALSSANLFAESFIVKFSSQKSLDSNPFLEKSNAKSIHSYRKLETQLGAFAVVDSALSLNEMNNKFSSHNAIEYIESNEINYRLIGEENASDARYSSQWGLNSTYGVDAPSAWAQQMGDKNIIVAVVDSGIDYNHEDLKENMWVNRLEANGKAGVDDDGNGVVDDIYGFNAYSSTGDPQDGNGHGTHCAGVIGAVHNSIGVAGIMKNVQLMAVKIFSDAGRTTTSAVISGIDYAIKQGAHVMSNSWGGSQRSQAIADAVKAAGDAGILFVAAAGNGNWLGRGIDIDRSPVYPAAFEYDHVISVGSIASSGKRSRFSNYGQKNVDLFAPGSAIISTYKAGGYKSLSGTSMATPHATGVIGLVLSEYFGSGMQEVKQRLLDGTKKLRSFQRRSVSGGILNAPGALGI